MFVRDRPQLAIGHQATANEDGAYLAIELANNGRQPTTLIKAGYLIDMEFEISNETKADLPTVPGKFEIRLDQALHRLVPPDTTTRYVLPLDADIPLRPFAVDSRKRRIWGGAAYEAMIGPRWLEAWEKGEPPAVPPPAVPPPANDTD